MATGDRTRRPAARWIGAACVLVVAAAAGLVPRTARGSGVCNDCVRNNDTTSTPGRSATDDELVSSVAQPPIAFIGIDSLLHVALPAGSGWTFETADTTHGTAGCALAHDEQGRPAVAYHDPNGILFVARRNAVGWVRQPVDPASLVIGGVSLRRTAGAFAIAYVKAATGLLMYAEQDAGGAWHPVPVAGGVAPEAYPSLAVDGAVRAISYHDAQTGTLRLAMGQSSGTWSTAIVDPTADVGGYTSLVGNAQSGFGIAYYDFTNADLKYAHMVPGGWAIDVVDGMGEVGRFCSAIAFGGTADDRVGIGYEDRTNGDLRYALLRNGAWTITVIDTAGQTGAFVSCVGSPVPADTIGIAYVERVHGDLRYTWRTNALAAVPPRDAAAGALHVSWLEARDGGGGTIRFAAPAAGPVRVSIYDAQGRLTATPLHAALPAGAAQTRWDGRDDRGRAARAGVFLVRVEAAGALGSAHAVLLR